MSAFVPAFIVSINAHFCVSLPYSRVSLYCARKYFICTFTNDPILLFIVGETRGNFGPLQWLLSHGVVLLVDRNGLNKDENTNEDIFQMFIVLKVTMQSESAFSY